MGELSNGPPGVAADRPTNLFAVGGPAELSTGT